MHRFSIILTVLIICLHFTFPFSSACSEEIQPKSTKKSQLEAETNKSYIRLKRAMEKEGFFSARIALNIWRINAINAGTFDPNEYDQVKRTLYESSVKHSYRYYQKYLMQKKYKDAKTCLEIWRLHSKEIGLFNPEKYQTSLKKIDKSRNALKQEKKARTK